MNRSNITDMLKKATQAMQYAYAPYSKFKVGACLRSADGQLFVGCNVENASYSLTFCAEANALGHLVMAGQTKITEVLIISSGSATCFPCGACRQRLYEFSTPETLVHCCTSQENIKTLTMHELLPFAFSHENLEKK
jgi:cytidine deaminase